MVGSVTGIGDFDPLSAGGILTSFNSFGTYTGDPFIAKYNSVGVYQWGDIITNGNRVDGRAVALTIDNSGAVFVVGDTNVGGSGGGFLAKYSPAGTRQFKIATGGYPGIESQVVTVDNVGGVYVGYSFGGTVDFDPGPGVVSITATSSAEPYFASYNANTGSLNWVRTFGSGSIQIDRLQYDAASGNLYTFGSFSGTIDFDFNVGTQNRTSNGAGNSYIAIYNTLNGNYVNVYPFNDASGVSIYGMLT